MTSLIALIRNPTLRTTAWSMAASFAFQAVLLVTGILMARLLGPVDRGHLALILLIPTLLCQIGGLGLPMSLTFHIARQPGHAPAMLHSLKKVWMAQVPLLFIAHAILLWVVLRDAPNSVQVAGLITLAITPATLAQQYGLGILQGFGRFSAFNLSKLLPLMSFAVALICLAAAGVVALGAVAVAFTASYLVFGASTLRRALRVATQEPSSPGAGSSRRALTVFGLRGFIGASPPVETYRVDQALVAMFLLPRDLGLYIVALSFVNFPRFLAQGIGVVAYSRIAASPDPQQARRSMWKFFWLSVPVYGPIILALALLAPILLPFFFGAVFASAVSVCQLLLINVLFICMRRVLSDGIRGLGYPSSGSRAEIATFVALLPLSVVLIPDHGIKGTAWALIASSVAGLMWLLLDLRFVLRRQTPVAPADAVAKAEPPGAPVDGLGPQ